MSSSRGRPSDLQTLPIGSVLWNNSPYHIQIDIKTCKLCRNVISWVLVNETFQGLESPQQIAEPEKGHPYRFYTLFSVHLSIFYFRTLFESNFNFASN